MITPMFNIYEQHLNHPICENIHKKENHKEDNLTPEEYRTQQARKDKKEKKGENITYDENITQHDRGIEKVKMMKKD